MDDIDYRRLAIEVIAVIERRATKKVHRAYKEVLKDKIDCKDRGDISDKLCDGT